MKLCDKFVETLLVHETNTKKHYRHLGSSYAIFVYAGILLLDSCLKSSGADRSVYNPQISDMHISKQYPIHRVYVDADSNFQRDNIYKLSVDSLESEYKSEYLSSRFFKRGN
jgi:hypothetical protein